MKILSKLKIAFLSKAYTEGIYSDTPANRKLGRVGMSYQQYANKIEEKPAASSQNKSKFAPLTTEDISLDNKNSIDIYREGSVYGSGESGTDIPILNKDKQIIGYIQKREVGSSGRWSWDYSFEKDKVNTIGNYETKKEAIEYFVKTYNENNKDNAKVVEGEVTKVKLKLEDFKENIINDDNQINITYTDKEGNKVGDMVIFKDLDEKTLYLEHIKVSEDYRKQGLARQIFKKGLQLSNKESKNFDTIELFVDNAENSTIQDKGEQEKNNKYLIDFYKSEGFEFKSQEDEKELNPIMIKKLKKAFTIEEIKKKINSELNKFKAKNDYIILSANNGYTFRLSRNMGEGQGFNECYVKNKEDKVLKTFKNAHEEDLIHSLSKYIQSIGVDITPVQNEGRKEEVNIENNTSIIKKKMKEAKDGQTGTILIKGSGDKLIYLNRNKQGRWLKDFDSFTIRDSKRNILTQGKAKSEEDLINKLNDTLTKNKIQLEEISKEKSNSFDVTSINIPKKVYHKSPPSLRENILNEGLSPKIGDSYETHWEGSKKKLEPVIFAYDKDKKEYDSTYDDDIYEIDTTKLKKENWKKDPDEDMYDIFGSVVYNEKIPKEAIKLIHEGTGEDWD